MAVYTKINNRDVLSLSKKFSVKINEVEIVKEDIIFKVPGKLN